MCVRSLGEDEQMALEDSACEDLRRPEALETCKSKDPCPGLQPVWLTGNWTQVSSKIQFNATQFNSIPFHSIQ
jgi:hypothetical protein